MLVLYFSVCRNCYCQRAEVPFCRWVEPREPFESLALLERRVQFVLLRSAREVHEPAFFAGAALRVVLGLAFFAGAALRVVAGLAFFAGAALRVVPGSAFFRAEAFLGAAAFAVLPREDARPVLLDAPDAGLCFLVLLFAIVFCFPPFTSIIYQQATGYF